MRLNLIPDTNVLVLFVVGLTSPDMVKRHGRCRPYTERDFRVAEAIFVQARQIVLLPNVLTETSNLLRQGATEDDADILSAAFGTFIAKQREDYVRSRDLVASPEFLSLGLTDAAILQLASTDDLILTTDHALYGMATHSNKLVVHFDHERARLS